jgi:hypothetical protein
MTREIKFRVWDGKQMDYKIYLGYENCSMNDLFNDEYMQYTGLKDKNGKEIYEGDIITGKYWCGCSIGNVLVEWDEDDYGWAPFGDYVCLGRYCDISRVDRKSIKVIGNIHENPELLK